MVGVTSLTHSLMRKPQGFLVSSFSLAVGLNLLSFGGTWTGLQRIQKLSKTKLRYVRFIPLETSAEFAPSDVSNPTNFPKAMEITSLNLHVSLALMKKKEREKGLEMVTFLINILIHICTGSQKNSFGDTKILRHPFRKPRISAWSGLGYSSQPNVGWDQKRLVRKSRDELGPA